MDGAQEQDESRTEAAARMRWMSTDELLAPVDELRSAIRALSKLNRELQQHVLDLTRPGVNQRQAVAREAEDHLAELESVFANSVFGVLVLDGSNHIVRANEFFARLAGYDLAALPGMPVSVFVDDSRPGFGSPADAGSTPEEQFAMGIAHRRLISRSGVPHFVTIEARQLDLSPERRIVIVHDVTQLHEANNELVSQARFDQQTGLLVRAHFRAQLAGELAHASRTSAGLAVLWIDLDGFKEINDRYGHTAGDMVLLEVARRLQKAGRRQDAVGRLGGDEFAMLVTDVDRIDNLETVTARILAELRVPVMLNDSSQVFVSGSMGIALSPEDGTDPDELMHNADTAMYSAKQAGRDRRVYFRPEMNQIAEARADMRYQLAAAIRSRAFTMHYQPVIDVRTGVLHSAEALVRWRRDDIVSASEFIGVAQQTGQLRAIGRVALDLIDEDLRTMDAEIGGPLPIALNLSPAQLEDRDLVDWLLAWEPAGGFARVIIEVTETATMAGAGRAVETLSLLSRLGARLSIDDFGTGYSNLALLDRLRPSLIKIDRSLLVRANGQDRGRSVLGAAVQLAHALDAEVVVEGVEDEPLWALTCSLGAELAQGFYLGRPMPLADLISWTRERGPVVCGG